MKVSFILIFFIIAYGIYSVIHIPKESAPNVKLGRIEIKTVFQWVNPNDIDSLVTEKVEKKISHIEGIQKINSISRTGFSSVLVSLKKNADTTEVFTQIQSALDTITLPSGSEKPIIDERQTDNNFIFELLLYWKKSDFSDFELRQKAKLLQNYLEANSYIESVKIAGYRTLNGWLFSDQADYRIKIILDKSKIQALKLSIHSVAHALRNANKNTTLWKHFIEWNSYNMYVWGKFESIEDLLSVSIPTPVWSIQLRDIAKVKKQYPIYRFRELRITGQKQEYNYISLIFSKAHDAQVWEAATHIKQEINDLLKGKDFSWLQGLYTKDLSYFISKDFYKLYRTALITLLLVFIVLVVFVWFKESIISIILLPISFFVSFIILYNLGFSLNIITNFSLIIAFGIMVDTIIVIVEGVADKRKRGHAQIESVLHTLNEFKSPLISGSITTLIAAFPMMFFPWVAGKFVSYIPITIFITIIATLIVTLTISSVLFLSFKSSHEVESQSVWLKRIRCARVRFLSLLSKVYIWFLRRVLYSKGLIIFYICIPLVLLIGSIIALSPRIGFTMFPDTDNGIVTIEFQSKQWLSKEYLQPYYNDITAVLGSYPELLYHYTTINDGHLFTYLELKEKSQRKRSGERNATEVVNALTKDFQFLEKKNFDVSVIAQNEGPRVSKNIWVKLIAHTSKDVIKLEVVWTHIQKFLDSFPQVKNSGMSNRSENGSFVYYFNREKLKKLGLTTRDITDELYFYINWLNAGTIKSEFENNKIVIFVEELESNLTPDVVENLIIPTKAWSVRVWDFMEYDLVHSVTSIVRENWKIILHVSADIKDVADISWVQKNLDHFLENYSFPEWVSVVKGGEIQENKEVLRYAVKSFVIAVSLIFLVLVFQFRSYSQAVLVLYSVVITLLGINIWLFVTGNSYSMPFIIGFIALAWIVVNDAIILVDVLNNKLRNARCHCQEKYIEVVIEASRSRLQPIIVTTLTTVLGISPLLFQDKFWETFAYTVVFGLSIWSLMTLIIIPIIYRLFYMKKFQK